MMRFSVCLLLFGCLAIVQAAEPLGWTSGIATFTGSEEQSAKTVANGACGYGELSSELYPGFNLAGVALDSSVFKGKALKGCGTCVEIKCTDEVCDPTKVLTVMLYDNCDKCGPEQVNLQAQPFKQLAPLDIGRIGIQFREVPCRFNGGVVVGVDRFRTTMGGWVRLVFKNVNGPPLAKVEFSKAGVNAWRGMSNNYGAAWEASRLPELPWDVKLTNIDGQSIVLNNAVTAANVGDVLSSNNFLPPSAPEQPKEQPKPQPQNPTPEAPKEQPKAPEVPKQPEQPKAPETPKKPEQPKAPETPKPVAEQPKTPEVPKQPEQPKAPEAPKEQPKAPETPKPVAEQPKAEQPKPVAEPVPAEKKEEAKPVAEQPKTPEAPKPVAEQPKAEPVPAAEKKEEAKPVAEQPKAEQPKPAAEQPKALETPKAVAEPVPAAKKEEAKPVAAQPQPQEQKPAAQPAPQKEAETKPAAAAVVKVAAAEPKQEQAKPAEKPAVVPEQKPAAEAPLKPAEKPVAAAEPKPLEKPVDKPAAVPEPKPAAAAEPKAKVDLLQMLVKKDRS